jgi:hypothetical protein
MGGLKFVRKHITSFELEVGNSISNHEVMCSIEIVPLSVRLFPIFSPLGPAPNPLQMGFFCKFLNLNFLKTVCGFRNTLCDCVKIC